MSKEQISETVCNELRNELSKKGHYGNVNTDSVIMTKWKEALNAIKEADLILLSMGSLFTSIIPNLLIDEVVKEIGKSKAKIMKKF